MLRQLPLLFCSLVLAGCGTGYLLQAARGQWQLSHRRQSIEKLLHSDATDAALKRRLGLVRAAREFASRELLLPDNASYRSYSVLARPYVVWNVVAAPELSVAPKHWCFLVVGCLAYRGYFREADARRYAATLQQQGYDVAVGGVAAYSTLGKFADPVIDTMLRYDDVELAGILFHELAHQLVYVKNDSAFNEAFATAVEREGQRRWARARHQEAGLQAYLLRETQQAATLRQLAAVRGELAALYASADSDAGKRQRKRELLATRTQQLLAAERAGGYRGGYDDWLQQGLNNAHLAAVATYFDCVPAFEALLASQRDSLPDFYAAVRGLAKSAPAARRQFCAGG